MIMHLYSASSETPKQRNHTIYIYKSRKPAGRTTALIRSARLTSFQTICLASFLLMVYSAPFTTGFVASTKIAVFCSRTFCRSPIMSTATSSSNMLHVSVRGCQIGRWARKDSQRRHRLFSSKAPLNEKGFGSNKDKIYTINLNIPTPEDMEDVGAVLSMGTGRGDVILLGGDLGAGKTCFSRGFVRARTGIMDMRVTSPTYLLSNTYQAEGAEIHHMDLYRLSGNKGDLAPLNMEHVLKNCISLIEWPSRLGSAVPTKRLDITFQIDRQDETQFDDESITRILMLKAYGSVWEDRLKLLEYEGYIDDLLVEDAE